ncbi:ABC transporter permease [Tenggerimyces flavus]|uniref:ABC transporter permease n=1 Tax=Tenggerimyces flavus TaxID=1708749 RepID=A0ABV7YJD7_9ACTN|nr:ABC transporter permease [Tenggerimyces flavus]MBM7787696.1 peptide/nickel transport system permease protein [Tenggerimyces flavus]
MGDREVMVAATDQLEEAAQQIPERRQPKRASFLERHGYVIGRIVKSLLTIFVVATGTFFLVRLLPGNPVDVYINAQIAQYGISYDEAASQAAGLFSFNPNEPMIIQYLEYLAGLVRGDLGDSLLSPGTSVLTLIATYLPWTLFSVGIGLIISFVVGIALGMLMAYRRGSWLDHVLTTLASLTHSIPNYLLSMLIVVFFGVQIALLPITQMRGAYSPGVVPNFSFDFLSDVLFHASLPITAYVLTTVGSWMLVMKSSTVETLGEDYVTVARARGLTDGRIQTAYVGRNAVLPLFSQLAIALGFVVGGSILVEQVFQYQGIGFLLFEAVKRRDYPILQGILLVITIAVIVANLLADLLYSRLDPRIRIAGKE